MEAKKYCYIRIEGSDNGGAVLNYDEKVKNGKRRRRRRKWRDRNFYQA